jgi:hypothetical protein
MYSTALLDELQIGKPPLELLFSLKEVAVEPNPPRSLNVLIKIIDVKNVSGIELKKLYCLLKDPGFWFERLEPIGEEMGWNDLQHGKIIHARIEVHRIGVAEKSEWHPRSEIADEFFHPDNRPADNGKHCATEIVTRENSPVSPDVLLCGIVSVEKNTEVIKKLIR